MKKELRRLPWFCIIGVIGASMVPILISVLGDGVDTSSAAGSPPAPFQYPRCGSIGDVDKNGLIDYRDATAIANHLGRAHLLDADQHKNADVNADDRITHQDIVSISQHLGGQIDILPACMAPRLVLESTSIKAIPWTEGEPYSWKAEAKITFQVVAGLGPIFVENIVPESNTHITTYVTKTDTPLDVPIVHAGQTATFTVSAILALYDDEPGFKNMEVTRMHWHSGDDPTIHTLNITGFKTGSLYMRK